MSRPLPESPMVVSYGAGVDSTAVLVGFYRRGIRPDMVIFSDTGGEKPETYAALDVMDRWLESIGFPKITRTHYNVVTARYYTLEGNCLQNDVLPSLAYGGHSCSLKWKIEAIDDHVWGVRGWQPALDALNEGRRVVRVIGYDDSAADRKRFAKMDRKAESEASKGNWTPWHNWYPLQAWGWTRKECVAAIKSEEKLAGLFVEEVGAKCPVKSACYFCPANKKDEIEALAVEHPDLALKAVVMEYRAETGKHGLRTLNGLGLGREEGCAKGTRNFSWRRHLLSKSLIPEDWKSVAEERGLLPRDWDDYAEECADRLRRLAEAQEAEGAAFAMLPDDLQEQIAGAKAAKLERIVETIDGPSERAWVQARAARVAIEVEKKAALSPDWRSRPKRKSDPAAARERRLARKRWRQACEAARASGL